MTGEGDTVLLGFGEVGQILGADIAGRGAALTAYDIAFDDPASAPARAARESTRVEPARSADAAAAKAGLIVSAVTAEAALEAARSVAGSLRPGAVYLDLNSASPGTKREAASLIEAAGGQYVEAAVMSPVPPKRLATPILLGGPHAQSFMPVAQSLGFTAMTVFSAELGKASAAKMCRSIVVKGMEALLLEALVTARHHGLEDTVLKSLDDLFPGPDWPELARYMISRSLEHGRRRAEEMREAARTVNEAGLEPLMSSAAAERQARAGALTERPDYQDLDAMLDALAQAARRAKLEAAQ
jgi:3-hydroxyisobutyrate dehydrogenase-like beta-hydroxyacid dehydrogenase